MLANIMHLFTFLVAICVGWILTLYVSQFVVRINKIPAILPAISYAWLRLKLLRNYERRSREEVWFFDERK